VGGSLQLDRHFFHHSFNLRLSGLKSTREAVRAHNAACSIPKTGENDSVRVTLLGNYLFDEQESMQNYARLLQGLLTQKGWEVEIVRPTPVFGRLKPSGRGLGKWLGYIDKFILFPMALRKHLRQRKNGEPFLIHICDHSNAMYTRWLRDVPHLVTCHDVLAIQSGLGLIPQHKTGWTGRILQKWILSGLKRAAYVICVSDQTREELLALAPELKDRSVTVENGLAYPFRPMPPDQAVEHLERLGFEAVENQFVLHVGGNQWYKNREAVLRLFGRLCAEAPDLVQSHRLKLVMVGKPPTPAMLRLVDQEQLAGKVVFLTGSNEELRAFYSLAEVLVFPSLREGFGWPLIEAQACGCPVLTSNRPPMKVVAGPAALLADPENIASFALGLRDLLREAPEARQQRRAEAQKHAAGYEPHIFLEKILRAYAHCCQGHGAGK